MLTFQRTQSDACILAQNLTFTVNAGDSYSVGFYGRQNAGKPRNGRIAAQFNRLSIAVTESLAPCVALCSAPPYFGRLVVLP